MTRILKKYISNLHYLAIEGVLKFYYWMKFYKNNWCQTLWKEWPFYTHQVYQRLIENLWIELHPHINFFFEWQLTKPCSIDWYPVMKLYPDEWFSEKFSPLKKRWKNWFLMPIWLAKFTNMTSIFCYFFKKRYTAL